jgi:hypothetical protein
MAEDNRLIEIMADILVEVPDIKVDLRDVKADLRDVKVDLRDFKNKSEDHFERSEQQQAKTNLALGELRLSVMASADRMELLLKPDQRVKALEELVMPHGPR